MIDRILLSADPKRDADAVKLAENGHLWPVVTIKQAHGAFPAGTVFYAVPSRSTEGARYLANRVYCECKDYRRAACAHQRAVIRFEERGVRPARQGYAAVMGFCGASSCQEDRKRGSDYCAAHELVDAF